MSIYRHIFMAAFTILSVASNSHAANILKKEDVEKFQFECWPDAKYDLDFGFSPVAKLPEGSRVEGQWSYKFTTDDKKYPDNKVSLPANQAVRVDLVLQINKSDTATEEDYLWSVIVAPTVNGWGYGGHWPTKKPINQYEKLKDKKESLIQMATLSLHDGQPVHTKISPKDIDSAGTLNNAWEDIFGKKIVSNLLYPGSKGAQAGERGYSLTFYYVPTPSTQFINDNGYKWPSFKHVDKEGAVYGFVLNSKGECLGWDSITVVK